MPDPAQSPTLFDRSLLRARLKRARALGAETFLIDRVAEELGERLAAVLRQFERAVDLGTPGDAVARVLATGGKVTTLVRAAHDTQGQGLRVIADEEALPFADARSTSSSRRWRCNSSMTCRAR